MSQPVQHKGFATTSPGLEDVLATELVHSEGVRDVRKQRAGCGFRADRLALERVTMTLRTAHRVLWTIGEVDAFDAVRLYESVRQLVRWQGLVPADKTFAVDATCRDTPAFKDARFAGLRVKDAIVDAVRDATGARPDVSVDDPDVVVRVSIARGRGVVSLDASGKTSLHARGYRIEAGEAPLRESLAAALTMLVGWDGSDASVPLVDPMCGSGTILIEAVLRARGIAPGLLRSDYGFMRWPGFKAARHTAAIDALKAEARGSLAAPVFGLDSDPTVIEIARANATRAGVIGDLELAVGDARAGVKADSGVLVTNPPWGGRMGDESSMIALLRAVAEQWSTFGRWRCAVLVPDAEAARAAALTERLVPVEAGGREVLVALGTWGR